MKSIILVRHATAIDRGNDLPDFERTLIKKGKKESRKMAQRFLSYQLKPEIWITSAAPRAVETASIFADILEFPRNKILTDEALYDKNNPESYIELITSLPISKNSVIFFGHDPGISECAATLVKNLQLDFPKAGVEGITLLFDDWKRLQEGEGYLTLIEFPGSRKGISRILQRNLTDLISLQNENIFIALTPKISRKLQKVLKSYSEKSAKLIVELNKKK
jgi:phosphohistidine phosphatase